MNHQILKSWQEYQMFTTQCMQIKKIHSLISIVTPGLKPYDLYLFVTEKLSMCKTELNLAAQDRSWSPGFTTDSKNYYLLCLVSLSTKQECESWPDVPPVWCED